MKRIYYLFVMLLLVVACQQEEEIAPQPAEPGVVPETPVLKGHVRVKLKAGIQQEMNVVKTRSGIASGISAIDLANVDLSVYRMERVFPYAGKFEERHREAGLDLWYDVYFDEKVPTRSAVKVYQEVPEIEYVETIPEARLCDFEVVTEPLEPLRSMLQRPRAAGKEAEDLPFNDPRLGEMWHYHNTGEKLNGLTGALEGADIGLFEAWKTETGSREVIVAVMDGGIQFNHPDLAANMWVNQAEMNGTAGVDDDNNGYVDDIYGWNFVTGKKETDESGNSLYRNGEITQYVHGTHCAGTISAVNGNGIGICGIAGGSGLGDGVRLMSCQIFHNDPATGESKAYADPNMYVYAADMGAVISSNSWTNGVGDEGAFLNSAMRSAIDYFIKYAGKDVSTKQQNGPMDGGLVVFAAANSNSDAKEWPASYSKALTVASMAHNFKRASYSNYGDWIDITAPGGEQSYGDSYAILSTSVSGTYAWLQGTSMACPHVSGCAALVLSKFQGKGYTPDDLCERLLNSTHNIDGYNQRYAGMLGTGCIDVGLALTPPSGEAPETSELTLIAAYDDWAIVEWMVKAAPDGPMSKYVLSWGEKSLEQTDAAGGMNKTINVRYVSAGTMLRDTVRGLEVGKTYYFSLQAYDRWGGVSAPAPQVEKTVTQNFPPQLAALWQGALLMDEGVHETQRLKVKDPEGQMVSCSITPRVDWLTWDIIGDTIVDLHLQPDYKAAGNYAFEVIVADQYGKSSRVNMNLEVIYKEIAPQILRSFTRLELPGNGIRTVLDLSAYFADSKGRALMYEVDNSSNDIASVVRNGNQLLIDPKQHGTTQVKIRAYNAAGLSVSQSFTVEVVRVEEEDLSNALAAYPNPVKTDLNISLLPSLRGLVTLRLYNAAGRLITAEQVTVGDNGYVLDMRKCQAGTYTLVVESVAGTWKKNIIKI